MLANPVAVEGYLTVQKQTLRKIILLTSVGWGGLGKGEEEETMVILLVAYVNLS